MKRPPLPKTICAHWDCWRSPWTHLRSCTWLRGAGRAKMEFTPSLCRVYLRRTDRLGVICRPTWCTSTGTSGRTFPGLWIRWSGAPPHSRRTLCRAWWLKVRFSFLAGFFCLFFLYFNLFRKAEIRVHSRGSVRTRSCLAQQVTPCQSQTTTEGLNPHLTHHVPHLKEGGGSESPWRDQCVKFSV